MPAALYLPRRHRRHLLFPPGLLALAGLLWLGCVAVPRIVRPTQYVKEVVFFPLHVPADSFGGFPTPQQIEDLGTWQSITLSGNPWADYFDVKIVENAGLLLAEKQLQHRALHVYLNASTSYNTFIQLLDIPNQLGIERYFIDLRKMPYSINLLGNIPHPNYPSFICGTEYMKPIKPFSEMAEEWITESWATVFAPDWRNTTLLLLLLTALSIRQLRRQWRAVAS
ncbi:hypothetical protein [Hymenobacter perfusus]|uniref:Uncharacterized protein n=1 Tax=Hymenobacter perfusus TaxID=1236770 RepID=A0A3R9NRW4_9BACT|nr:hypothetical protein [Hymenobacter perfusus]RSK42176.1 hypothetical protein EI293_14700 [Hymenobacter perfusus]